MASNARYEIRQAWLMDEVCGNIRAKQAQWAVFCESEVLIYLHVTMRESVSESKRRPRRTLMGGVGVFEQHLKVAVGAAVRNREGVVKCFRCRVCALDDRLKSIHGTRMIKWFSRRSRIWLVEGVGFKPEPGSPVSMATSALDHGSSR